MAISLADEHWPTICTSLTLLYCMIALKLHARNGLRRELCLGTGWLTCQFLKHLEGQICL